MSAMRHSSARVLEFESLREILRGYTWSALGRERVAQLEPQTDSIWIERQHKLTSEVRGYLKTGGRFDFSGLQDLNKLLDKSRISGAALEPEELRDILLLADRASAFRDIAVKPPEALRDGWPTVEELGKRIADFRPLLGYFKGKLLPDGTLDDHASPELARLRRETEKQKRSIQETLRGWLRRLSEGGAVQDELITIRGERFVIPVKAEQKRKISGVMHGA